MVKGKQKFALWLTPEAKGSVESHFRKDNCQSQSEYIEKAIRFYSGYLDTEQADSYLPRVLAEVLEGKLSALGSRIGKLLFKLSVEEAIMAQIVAYGFDVDLDTLKKVRVNCIKDIKETNGEVDFEAAYKYQKRLD
ncbi:MAG: hypothetical protein HFF49_00230 [Lawsonibacter sp.]|jgi:hypothetical protein|nr:hypothetical protein [Lawsonibacter sp.]